MTSAPRSAAVLDQALRSPKSPMPQSCCERSEVELERDAPEPGPSSSWPAGIATCGATINGIGAAANAGPLDTKPVVAAPAGRLDDRGGGARSGSAVDDSLDRKRSSSGKDARPRCGRRLPPRDRQRIASVPAGKRERDGERRAARAQTTSTGGSGRAPVALQLASAAWPRARPATATPMALEQCAAWSSHLCVTIAPVASRNSGSMPIRSAEPVEQLRPASSLNVHRRSRSTTRRPGPSSPRRGRPALAPEDSDRRVRRDAVCTSASDEIGKHDEPAAVAKRQATRSAPSPSTS